MTRQDEILAFIRSFITENNHPPTYREIGAACRLSSTSHVSYYLDQLQRAGYLTRKRYRARSLRLTHNR